MRWKALISAILIIAIIGFLLTTETGKKYFQFLRTKVGEFLSVILKGAQPKGEAFRIILEADKEAFYTQSYSLVNAEFNTSGNYKLIKIGEQLITPKKVEPLMIRGMNGLFEYTKEGSIKLSVDSNYLELGDLIFPKPSRVELEMVPSGFTLKNLNLERIVLSSVTGEIKGFQEGVEKPRVAPLLNSKLEINNFNGELRLVEDEISLEGMVSSVIGEKFTFT